MVSVNTDLGGDTSKLLKTLESVFLGIGEDIKEYGGAFPNGIKLDITIGVPDKKYEMQVKAYFTRLQTVLTEAAKIQRE